MSYCNYLTTTINYAEISTPSATLARAHVQDFHIHVSHMQQTKLQLNTQLNWQRIELGFWTKKILSTYSFVVKIIFAKTQTFAWNFRSQKSRNRRATSRRPKPSLYYYIIQHYVQKELAASAEWRIVFATEDQTILFSYDGLKYAKPRELHAHSAFSEDVLVEKRHLSSKLVN